MDAFATEYLLGRPRSEMLRVLFSEPRKGWTVRELRERTTISEVAIRRELRAMHALDLLTRSRSGDASFSFEVDPTHSLACALRELVGPSRRAPCVSSSDLRHSRK